jgi:hypothetical protein
VGDAQLHRGRNAVAKKFPRAQFSAQKSTQRINADGLRVSALSQFFPRRESLTRPRSFAANFCAHGTARTANIAAQKFFHAECVFGCVEAPNEAQNARISAK